MAAKKTCTSWHFSLGLVIRPLPKNGFSSPIDYIINASQEKVCRATTQQNLIKYEFKPLFHIKYRSIIQGIFQLYNIFTDTKMA